MGWSRVTPKYSVVHVPYTWSTADTAYCIIPASTVSPSLPVSHLSTDYVVLNLLDLHKYKPTNDKSLSSCHTTLWNYCLRTYWFEVLPQSRCIILFECILKFAQARPQCGSSTSLDAGLHLLLQTGLITACKFTSKLHELSHPCVCPKLLHYDLLVYFQIRSITMS